MPRFPSILALTLAMLATGPAHAVDVTGDDTADAYVVSGAVLLPTADAEAASAAACTTCQWRFVHPCASGNLESRAACSAIACDTARGITEIWRAEAEATPPIGDRRWRYLGTRCLSQAPPTLRAFTRDVREATLRYLPALRPASLPAGTTLLGLPTYFASQQPATFVAHLRVAETEVTLRARPTWRWEFDGATRLITRDPGKLRRTGALTHRFARSGTYRVHVCTVWRANYDANGLRALPIDGTLTQSGSIDIRVTEARGFHHT